MTGRQRCGLAFLLTICNIRAEIAPGQIFLSMAGLRQSCTKMAQQLLHQSNGRFNLHDFVTFDRNIQADHSLHARILCSV
jgi:hypothetical protein